MPPLIMQIIHRIDGRAIDQDLVVEVGPGGAARHAHASDDLATANFLPHDDIEGVEVAILGGKAVPMVNQCFVPIA